MYKIIIKDTCRFGSISNAFFSIEKGQIVAVDDKFPFNPEVFERVEDETTSKELSDEQIEGILDIDVKAMEKELSQLKKNEDIPGFDPDVDKVQILKEKPIIVDELTEFKKRIQEKDLNYGQLQQLLKAEKKGRKRKAILEYLKEIPQATDSGVNITEQTMFMTNLRTVPFITDKAVHLIVKTFETREGLTKALKGQHKLFRKEEYRNDFTPQLMEHLKKYTGLIKSVVTTKEVVRKGMRRAKAMPAPAVSAVEGEQEE